MNELSRVDIMGYPVSGKDICSLVKMVEGFIRTRNGSVHYMACLNPHSFIVAEDDKNFNKALKSAEILLADGAGIAVAAALLGVKLHSRIAGFEFFQAVNGLSRKRSIRMFFLGSTHYVLGKLEDRMKIDYPHADVVGTYSPSFNQEFSEEENKLMINAINSAKPDVLWVGMTAPKQERWIYANREKLDVGFVGAIGAVFDFYAGTKYRAPGWVCRIGLEWLPRFFMEPRRLWKRNLISTPKFLYRIIQWRLGLIKNN